MTTQHTMADPINEAFAEHRKVLAQRDELVAALQLIADSETSQAQSEYMQGIARAALGKVAA